MAEAWGKIRDRAGLEGAITRPEWFGVNGRDLAEQAAALAHGIAEGQNFIDGNKRIAALCVEVFLDANGFALVVSDETLADWILGLAVRDEPIFMEGHEIDGLSMEELAIAMRPWIAEIAD